ncbi:MAG: hypothetical protein GX362_00360 [Methanosarcinaceae archaeon]|nr:hypothetical protein [Methanosarcinaceae archaeon]
MKTDPHFLFSTFFIFILFVASVQDIVKRRVSDKLWFVAIATYIIIFFYYFFHEKPNFEILKNQYNILKIILFFAVFAILFIIFQIMFRLKMAGGADLKCFLLIFLFNTNEPLYFPITFFTSLIITLIYPILIFLYNILFQFEYVLKKPIFSFLGIRKNIFNDLIECESKCERERENEIESESENKIESKSKSENKIRNKNKNYFLLEKVDFENGKIVSNFFGFDIFSENEQKYRKDLISFLEKNKSYKIQWITPKIPFMLSILGGYAVSYLIHYEQNLNFIFFYFLMN